VLGNRAGPAEIALVGSVAALIGSANEGAGRLLGDGLAIAEIDYQLALLSATIKTNPPDPLPWQSPGPGGGT
jgi:hypothetical protein